MKRYDIERIDYDMYVINEQDAGDYVLYSDVAPLVDDNQLMAKWIVNHYQGTKDYGCRECVGDDAMSTDFRCGYHVALSALDADGRGG